MDKIYLVYGSTGIYEDRAEWDVMAFAREKDAIEFVQKVNARFRQLWEQYKVPYDIPQYSNEFDPKMRVGCNGTKYSYAAVPFYN